jgi:hypothetical protein
MKRPTRKRSADSAAVDCRALLSYIMRRCGRGCSPEYYLVVADNFFENANFSDSVKEQVCTMIKERTEQSSIKAISLPPVLLNGSTVCSKCGRRVDQHPKRDHFTILCNGQKIRVSE